MNSADRSIGRMDLALRRRFLWLELLPRPDVLQKWLARAGNNPVGFSADSLRQCNALLDEVGIPPEQHIGHALFMVQTPGSETVEPEDRPLRRELLERIVRFSVLPYLKELFLMQFGRVDQTKIALIEGILLSVVTANDAASSGDGS
jgi:5-methylcytosine-specific restriction enzyme B